MAKARDGMKPIGHGVTWVLEGNTLIVAIPVDAQAVKGAPLSSTGKSRLVGSTGGWAAIPDPKLAGFRMNVMVSAPLEGAASPGTAASK